MRFIKTVNKKAPNKTKDTVKETKDIKEAKDTGKETKDIKETKRIRNFT